MAYAECPITGLTSLGLAAQFRRQKGPVTDILRWVQCYATLASVLASVFPQKIPELTAYLSTIVKCHKEFEGAAWVLYDRACRRQAEVSRDLNWSKINPSMFNLCFTCRAHRRLLCHVCLSEGHGADHCPELNMQWPMLPTFFCTLHIQGPLTPFQTAPIAGQRRPSSPQIRQGSQTEICWLFNSKAGNKCTFWQCRYLHICSVCRQNGHGAGSCLSYPERKGTREQ